MCMVSIKDTYRVMVHRQDITYCAQIAGTCIQQRSGHTEGIQDLALNADGSLALTGSDDTIARIYDFRSVYS